MVILTTIGPRRNHDDIVRVGIELAEAYGEELRLLHVEEPTDGEVDSSDIGQPNDTNMARLAARVLEETQAEGTLESVEITADDRKGDPVEEILSEVGRLNPTFLLIGSRQRSPVGKVVFGSHTRSLLLNARCPILSVGLEKSESDNPISDLNGPIIAAVDRSQRSKLVVRAGADLADRLDKELHVAHVLSVRDFVNLEQTSYETTGRAINMDEVREIASDFARTAAQHASVASTPVGLIGNPAEEIEAYAEKQEASYIVVSSRRRSSVGKAIFGSVAQSIILSANQPVLLAHSNE